MSDLNSLDITSANAKVILTVENLYPSGVEIQNFSTDSAWAVDDAVVAEARMGVDGHMAAGYTPTPRNVTISLEANSPSLAIMNNLISSMQLNKTVYKCTMQITIPSIGKEYTLKEGVLLQGHAIPDGKKVLDPSTWQFTFGECKPSSI